MIHVAAQPEPPDFDRNIRQKGLAWLRKKSIKLNAPLPPGTKIPSYWRQCLDTLYNVYKGHCAYLAVFFENTSGCGTVDHFIPKSQSPALAYDWHNYRLACSRINSRKRNFTDVLDPFQVQDGWFHLELVTGHIFPDPQLPEKQQQAVQKTIDRLKLDDPANREMRARHYQGYCEKTYTEEHFKKYSPFVWLEAKRQGLV